MDARSASDAEIHQDTLLMKHSRTHRINTWIILETARWLLVGVQYRGPIHRCYRSSSRQKSASCSTLLLCAALQPGFRRKKKEIVSRIFEANLILKRNPTAKPSRFGTIVWPKLFIYILASDAINELSYAGLATKIQTSGQRAIANTVASAVENSVQESYWRPLDGEGNTLRRNVHPLFPVCRGVRIQDHANVTRMRYSCGP